MVISRARPHLLFPEDPVMRKAFRVVTSLGYPSESLKKPRQTFEGIVPDR